LLSTALEFIRGCPCQRMSAVGGEGSLSSADIFRTRGGGSIFCDFVRTSFMDGPYGHCMYGTNHWHRL